MTLLEAMVALVMLGVSAVGYLQRFQADAQGVRRASEWARAVAAAEVAMESGKLADASAGIPETGLASVRRVPWRGRVEDVQATVRLPDGSSFTLHRLSRGQ